MTCFSPTERCTLPPPQPPLQLQQRVLEISSPSPPARWSRHWRRRGQWDYDDLMPAPRPQHPAAAATPVAAADAGGSDPQPTPPSAVVLSLPPPRLEGS